MNPEIPESKRRKLMELLSEGRKIEAIKVYREATGFGLKESKDAVEAMELAPRDFLQRDITNPPAPGGSSQRTVSGLSAAEHAIVVESIRQGRKIEAIKSYMDATGLGLKESKDAVEAMQILPSTPESPLRRPHSDPFENKNKGCLGVIAVLCAAAFLSVHFIEHYLNPPLRLIGQQPKTIIDFQP